MREKLFREYCESIRNCKDCMFYEHYRCPYEDSHNKLPCDSRWHAEEFDMEAEDYE